MALIEPRGRIRAIRPVLSGFTAPEAALGVGHVRGAAPPHSQPSMVKFVTRIRCSSSIVFVAGSASMITGNP